MCDGGLVAVTRAMPGVLVVTLWLDAEGVFETRVVGGARSGVAWRWGSQELALMQHARVVEGCQAVPAEA